MKKVTNSVEYTLKGELIGFESGIMEALKKDAQDEVDMNEVFECLKEFCLQNIGKEIDFKLVLKLAE